MTGFCAHQRATRRPRRQRSAHSGGGAPPGRAARGTGWAVSGSRDTSRSAGDFRPPRRSESNDGMDGASGDSSSSGTPSSMSSDASRWHPAGLTRLPSRGEGTGVGSIGAQVLAPTAILPTRTVVHERPAPGHTAQACAYAASRPPGTLTWAIGPARDLQDPGVSTGPSTGDHAGPGQVVRRRTSAAADGARRRIEALCTCGQRHRIPVTGADRGASGSTRGRSGPRGRSRTGRGAWLGGGVASGTADPGDAPPAPRPRRCASPAGHRRSASRGGDTA